MQETKTLKHDGSPNEGIHASRWSRAYYCTTEEQSSQRFRLAKLYEHIDILQTIKNGLREDQRLSEELARHYDDAMKLIHDMQEQWKVNFPKEWQKRRSYMDVIKDYMSPPQSPLNKKRKSNMESSTNSKKYKPE